MAAVIADAQCVDAVEAGDADRAQAVLPRNLALNASYVTLLLASRCAARLRGAAGAKVRGGGIWMKRAQLLRPCFFQNTINAVGEILAQAGDPSKDVEDFSGQRRMLDMPDADDLEAALNEHALEVRSCVLI